MEAITIIYFFYMFVSIYFLILMMTLFLRNRKSLFGSPSLNDSPSLSVLVPAFNESKTIKSTIDKIFDSDYQNLLEVIVINDGSTDNTSKIVKKLIGKYGSKLKLIDKKNSGKADSLNQALKIALGDFISIIDADSFPDKSAFSKLMGYFEDPYVGAVTAACTPKNRNTFLEKMQTIEYKVIALTRKLLEYIDSIYVVPGSMSIYRKKALLSIGGFDTKNLTEDIESTWHLLKDNWKVRMSLSATVRTTVPNRIKPWFNQRVRWNVGGFQVLKKYSPHIMKRNMLGYFVIPFFAFGLLLSLIGLFIFLYLAYEKLTKYWLITNRGAIAGVDLFTLSSLGISPSILNYFGVVLFAFFFFFTILILFAMKDELGKKESLFNLIFYMTLYLISYSVVIVWGTISWLRGTTKWR